MTESARSRMRRRSAVAVICPVCDEPATDETHLSRHVREVHRTTLKAVRDAKAMADQVELFHPDPVMPNKETQRRPKSQGAAWCPSCPTASTPIGTYASGEHLLYREHSKVTWSGARVTCPCSGARLCMSIPLKRGDGKRILCSCNEKSPEGASAL